MISPLCFAEIIFENIPLSSSGHIKLCAQLFTLQPLTSIEVHFTHVFVLITQGFFLIPFFVFLYQKKKNKEFFLFFIFLFFMNIMTVLFYFIKSILQINTPLFFGFLVTALFLFLLSFGKIKQKKDLFEMNFTDACILGLLQSLSLLPGISRFASLLFGAYYCNFFQYDSFIIAIMSNIFIATESFFYLVHQFIFNKNSFFLLERINYNYLLSSVFFSSFLLLFIYFLFKRKQLYLIACYLLLVAALSFYLDYF